MIKAKIIATGEAVDVIEVKDYESGTFHFIAPEYGRKFEPCELFVPLIPEESPETATIVGYVARNATGKILLFKGKEPPERLKYHNAPKQWCGSNTPCNGIPIIPQDSFPSVTWKSEPLKVKLTITPTEE